MSANPFRVFLTVQVKPGREADFEAAWHEGSKAVTSQSANLSHLLARSTKDDNVYYVVSDWTDEATFRSFESSDEHIKHRERLHPFRDGGAMATMNVVAEAAR